MNKPVGKVPGSFYPKHVRDGYEKLSEKCSNKSLERLGIDNKTFTYNEESRLDNSLLERGCHQVTVPTTVPTYETKTEVLQPALPALNVEALFNIQSTSKYYKSKSEERASVHKSKVQVSLPQPLTETRKIKSSKLNVKTAISDSARMVNTTIPATRSIVSQMETNKLVLPSIDDFTSNFSCYVSTERAKSKMIYVMTIETYDDHDRPLVFTNKAIKYFTAAKIDHDIMKNAIKYKKSDTQLDIKKNCTNISCYYIDNQSIIKAYREICLTNKDLLEELFCFHDESSGIATLNISSQYFDGSYGLDRFVHKNCFHVVKVDQSEFGDGTNTYTDIQESDSKLIAYIAAKRYQQLMNLVATVLDSSFDQETITHDLRQIFFPYGKDSSGEYDIDLTPETVFKNIKFHPNCMKVQSLELLEN